MISYTLVTASGKTKEYLRQSCWGYLTKESEDIITKIFVPFNQPAEVLNILLKFSTIREYSSHFSAEKERLVIIPTGMNVAALKINLQIVRAVVTSERRGDGIPGLPEYSAYYLLDPYLFDGSSDMGHRGIISNTANTIGKRGMAENWLIAKGLVWKAFLGGDDNVRIAYQTEDIYPHNDTPLSDEKYQDAVSECVVEYPKSYKLRGYTVTELRDLQRPRVVASQAAGIWNIGRGQELTHLGKALASCIDDFRPAYDTYLSLLDKRLEAHKQGKAA